MVVALERTQAAAWLGAGAGVALLMWAAVVALLAVATRAKRPEAAPAGLELGGDEPPAVVNLLTNGWKVRGEALSATLVDLAARHVLAFEQGDDGRLVVRVPASHGAAAGAAGATLNEYERRIVDVVRRRASNGVVPLEALTLGTPGDATAFCKRFDRMVVADARRRGLSRPRWSHAATALVGAFAVAPSLLVAGAIVALPDAHQTSTSSKNDDPIGAFIGIALLAWVGLMAAFQHLRAERDTPEGMATAGRWLGLRENLDADGTFPDLPPTAVAMWDRILAYAVALGVAVSTERAIPLGAESDREAWSAVGGRWRVVRVRYPRRIPPGWGRPPWKVALVGLCSTAAASLVGVFVLPALYDVQGDVVDRATASQQNVALGVSVGIAVVAAGLIVVALRGAWMLVLGVADLGRSRTIEGRVLRVRTRDQRCYVAVDDGSAAHLAAWVTTHAVSQGTDVRATVATHVGYVQRIEVVATAVAPVGAVGELGAPDGSTLPARADIPPAPVAPPRAAPTLATAQVREPSPADGPEPGRVP